MNNKNRHAYLIMAHNDFYVLEKLLLLLDDERNDIYIHIDNKVKNFDFDYFQNLIQKSNIFFTDRINVYWGDYSMIKCEYILLEQAFKGNYMYYHYITGVDLPIKSQAEIHAFFDKHNGKEFVHFTTHQEAIEMESRVKQYHFFKFRYRNSKILFNTTKLLEKALTNLQISLSIQKKWEDCMPIKFGACYFSVTHDLVRYILEKREWVEKYFSHSFCADEIFVQTIVFNSVFKDKLYNNNFDGDYNACMRHIDWKRGNPYVFTINDYKELMSSDRLFARKFSSAKDSDIIDMIYSSLRES